MPSMQSSTVKAAVPAVAASLAATTRQNELLNL